MLLPLSGEELSGIAYGQTKSKPVDERRAGFEERIKGWVAELGKVGVTRQLLWQEYRQAKPEGYGYTQFCEHLKPYARRHGAAMHFEHKAGDRLMIGFAGKMLSYAGPQTGEAANCPVFIAVLPSSGYSCVEALPSQCQEDFIGAMYASGEAHLARLPAAP